jgi:hypothetical protein
LKEFGVDIGNQFIHFKNLFTKELTVGSEDMPTGIQLYDDVDSAPYCVYVYRGELIQKKGLCEAQPPLDSTDTTVPNTSETAPATDQGTTPTQEPTTTPEATTDVNTENTSTQEIPSGDTEPTPPAPEVDTEQTDTLTDTATTPAEEVVTETQQTPQA